MLHVALDVTSDGLLVTGGMTIDNDQSYDYRVVFVTGGLTVESGGIKVTNGDVDLFGAVNVTGGGSITGGLSVWNTGLVVQGGGLWVSHTNVTLHTVPHIFTYRIHLCRLKVVAILLGIIQFHPISVSRRMSESSTTLSSGCKGSEEYRSIGMKARKTSITGKTKNTRN